MAGIIGLLKEAGLECLPSERVNLDAERFGEYRDSYEHLAEEAFERPALTEGKKGVRQVRGPLPSIFQYFLDGSRRTYKVADLLDQGRYLPLVAGQVGVGVMQRAPDGKSVLPVREFCSFENVVAFPDRVSADDLRALSEKLESQGLPAFRLVHYTVKPDRDPIDLGVAAIMSEMHRMEVSAVQRMADGKFLANDRMLIIDGPLRFRKSFDLVQFRNVTGLSKTFRPSFVVGRGRGRIAVGALTVGLDFGERTTVFRTLEDEKTIGVWYLRLRPRQMMSDPLQGIVKAERYAIDPEARENGFDPEITDVMSAHLLAERNLTPYKADSRWASPTRLAVSATWPPRLVAV